MSIVSDRTCLTYWFPRLQSAGLPVPRTALVDAGPEWLSMIGIDDDPVRHKASCDKAIALIDAVADGIRGVADSVGGYPLFLRTGHFSGKHNFSKTCHVPDASEINNHVATIVVMSEMFSMFGELPYKVWAVREMLPVKPITTLPAYGGMPLVREVRCFIAGGKVTGWTPYWPDAAIKQGFPPGDDDSPILPPNIDSIIAEAHAIDWPAIRPLAEQVAAVFADDGEWSVDILETDGRVLYVTDMAEKARSFCWQEGLREP